MWGIAWHSEYCAVRRQGVDALVANPQNRFYFSFALPAGNMTKLYRICKFLVMCFKERDDLMKAGKYSLYKGTCGTDLNDEVSLYLHISL